MEQFSLQSSSRTELIDITGNILEIIKTSGIRNGLVTVYCPHTTGGITINEGADPMVKRDILHVINKIIPWEADYRHMEGNSPAHIKTMLTGSSVQVIIENNKLRLGTWQKIFFCEYDGPRKRKVWIQALRA